MRVFAKFVMTLNILGALMCQVLGNIDAAIYHVGFAILMQLISREYA